MAWITCCFTWKMEALLSILLANTPSLDNKLDELRRMMALFSETETRLDSSLDSASHRCVFSIHCHEWTVESGKGGSVFFMINFHGLFS